MLLPQSHLRFALSALRIGPLGASRLPRRDQSRFREAKTPQRSEDAPCNGPRREGIREVVPQPVAPKSAARTRRVRSRLAPKGPELRTNAVRRKRHSFHRAARPSTSARLAERDSVEDDLRIGDEPVEFSLGSFDVDQDGRLGQFDDVDTLR